MFEYIRGTLVEKKPACVVIDVGGIGYALDIPVSTYETLPETRNPVTLLTHFHVREDVQKLYGFSLEAERDAFRKLIGVAKIGPKVALSILSSVSVRDLAVSVATQDPSRLKAVSGIGPKTAQRLVMELKGKFQAEIDVDVIEAAPVDTPGDRRDKHVRGQEDLFAALISLGYSEQQVQRAVARVRQSIKTEAPIEEWIRKALQVI